MGQAQKVSGNFSVLQKADVLKAFTNMKWNKRDYSFLFWDISVHNTTFLYFSSLDLTLQVDTSALTVVYSDGSVLWIPPAKLKVWATRKDTQSSDADDDDDYDWEASFKFGSWAYDGFLIDPDWYEGLQQADLTDYIPRLFSITSTTAVKNLVMYPCCLEPYPDLTFTIRMKTLEWMLSCNPCEGVYSRNEWCIA